MLIIGFIVGLLAMYQYMQPKTIYRGNNILVWADLADKNQQQSSEIQKEVSKCNVELSSASSQIKDLVNRPDPSPQIKYITQTKEVNMGCPRYFTSVNGTNCIPAISLCY